MIETTFTDHPLVRLSEHQVEAFDADLMNPQAWATLTDHLARGFNGEFRFLDLGAGNGAFADGILMRFPRSDGTLLELSEEMVRKIRPDARKTVVHGNALELDHLGLGKFDVIFCNWLLHHLVSPAGYSGTLGNIRATLRVCAHSLTARGRLSVYENDYNGFIDGAPSRIIYALTRSQYFAPLVGRMGANTAGAGVCFLSHRSWLSILNEMYVVLDHTPQHPWLLRLSKRIPLLLKDVRYGHYWLEPRLATMQ
ncbi:MAG TPA: class I SAM-dependent methyltransferase [Nitrospiraceae bacterium]|nr:class I SAM-dependent methyltransferase [Nitrospiraceae bacterium]